MSTARIRLYAVAGVGAAGLLFALLGALWARDRAGTGATLFWSAFGVLLFYAMAVWLVRRRPDHPQARRLLLFGASTSVGLGFEVLLSDAAADGAASSWFWLANLGYQFTVVLSVTAVGLLIMSYPDGEVERPWQVWSMRALWLPLAVPGLLLLAGSELVIIPYLSEAGLHVDNPLAVSGLAWAEPALRVLLVNYPAAIIAAAILFWRYAQAAPAQRQRMRLLVWTIAVGLVGLAIDTTARVVAVPRESGWLHILGALWLPITLMIPVSIVVGVLRHQLFGIEVVIRRSVVYGALSLAVAAIYIALAAAPGLALGRRIPVELAVAVTILAAVAFAPLRRRLESVADQWVFGERINRYQLLTSFGSTLEATPDLSVQLPQLADAARRGLGASWVRVSLRGEVDGAWLAEPVGLAGTPTDDAELNQELRRAGQVIGRIECGPKPDGYDDADRELLTTLAGQAATAIANVRLAAQLSERLEELSRSRSRIVAAQDAQARRIERDIHDGVQQEVVALITNLRLARNQLARGDLSDAMLAELQSHAGDMLVDLRELAHGIHPPVLTDNGLIAAVQARAGRLAMDVAVHADRTLRTGRLDAEVEGAAYYVICEALTNVVKHADATTAQIGLTTADGTLSLVVRDNGKGLGERNGSGTGLTNLRDRVDALGGSFRLESQPNGGTCLRAELPIRVDHA